jgi:putative effector of murein hydrolase LrgA (UPF0299 family)
MGRLYLEGRQVVGDLDSRVLIPLVAVVVGQVLICIILGARMLATQWLNSRAHNLQDKLCTTVQSVSTV